MRAPPEERPSIDAHVLAAFGVAAVLCVVDTIGLVRRPPGLEVGAGTLLFVAIGLALGGSLAAAVVAARRALRGALDRFGRGGAAAAGALDAIGLYLFAVVGQDPRDLQGESRGLALVGAIAGGALAGVLLGWAGPRRAKLAGVAAIVGAGWFIAQLRWIADPWARLGGHLVLFVAGAQVLAPLVARVAARRTTIALALLALVLLVAADPALRASRPARMALWGRSADVWAWAYLLTKPLDRDGDGAVAWLGGVDCDPAQRSVHPGAAERAGNGRDDDCRGGDAPVSHRAPAVRAAPPPVHPPDLLLISLDSLRWDAAGELREVRRALGPHADFVRAVSPAAKTSNTLSAFLRGKPVREVALEPLEGVRGLVVWRDRSPTLGHVLSARGYRAVTVPTDGYLDPRYGVAAGFEAVYPANREARGLGMTWQPFDTHRVRAAPSLQVLLRLARETPGPIAAWIHLMDSHFPFYWSEKGSGPHDLGGLRHSIRSQDALLAGFLRDWETARHRKPTVAIFGDHGEEVGEHGGSAHGSSVHGEQVRVALLVAGDGIPGGRFDAAVSVSSLAPTFLELAGASVPPTMTEPSLLPALRRVGPWPTVAVSESWVASRSWVGYSFGRHRLLVEPVHDLVELYDVERDPYEKVDLAGREPARLRRLLAAARRWDAAH